jgi:AcrR family transcriptional regulator
VSRPERAARPSDVRAALLDAAREELREHGPAGVSLRAVARRAGVSHAAPKHHFRDRAGLLTALARQGHDQLRCHLVQADPGPAADTAQRVDALGRAYIEFGLDHRALFDLMFRPDQLHPDDPDLATARSQSLAVLVDALHASAPAGPETARHPPPDLALIAWAFAHGLVVLTRDGALLPTPASSPKHTANDEHALVLSLITTFTSLLNINGPGAPRRC